METVEEMRALFESIRNDIKKLEDQISAVDTLLHRFDQCHHQSSVGSDAQRRNNSLEYYKSNTKYYIASPQIMLQRQKSFRQFIEILHHLKTALLRATYIL